MDYKVWIVPGRHQLGRSSKTSANVYMYICGELAKTDKIQVPKDCLEFSFEVGFCVYFAATTGVSGAK